MADQFYGGRLGVIVDAFGHRRYVAMHSEDVSDKELLRRMRAQGGLTFRRL